MKQPTIPWPKILANKDNQPTQATKSLRKQNQNFTGLNSRNKVY